MFFIINLDSSDNKGTHWTPLYFHPLNSCYFHGYGFVPIRSTKDKTIYFYDADIQDFNSETCGYYALAFLKFLHDKTKKEVAFKEFLKL